MKTNHEWTRSSWKSFPPKCLSSWPFTDPFGVFSNPLESLRGPPCPTFGGSFLSLLQPLSGPSPFFVALRGFLFAFSWKPFLPLATFGGSFLSLLQPLRVPSWSFVSRTPLESFPTPWSPFADPLGNLWRILLEPSPTPSWPFAVLRGPSWTFCLFVETLSLESFPTPWSPFADPLARPLADPS